MPSHYQPDPEDVTRPSRPTMNHATNRLYQKVFDETVQQTTASSAPREIQTPSTEGAESYNDTVIAVHHSKKGFRIVLQANHKTFLVIVILVLAVLSRPGLVDLLSVLLKSLVGH